ncbi:predicted protein, partial [Arabidopsis lyrata subsp. lyrata]
CAKTPRRFVEDFPQEEVEAFGPGLKLLVADINTGSMVYVWKRSIHEKRLHVDDVAHGVHTISETGFDSNSLKDNCLRENFNAMIAGHAELPPIQKIVEDLMREPPFFLVTLDIPGKKYRTVRTFGMDIKANRPKARFYERHLNDDEITHRETGVKEAKRPKTKNEYGNIGLIRSLAKGEEYQVL